MYSLDYCRHSARRRWRSASSGWQTGWKNGNDVLSWACLRLIVYQSCQFLFSMAIVFIYFLLLNAVAASSGYEEDRTSLYNSSCNWWVTGL